VEEDVQMKKPRAVLLNEARPGDRGLRDLERKAAQTNAPKDHLRYLHARVRTEGPTGDLWHEIVMREVCAFLRVDPPMPYGKRDLDVAVKYRGVGIRIGHRSNNPKYGLRFHAFGAGDPLSMQATHAMQAVFYTHGPDSAHFNKPWAFMGSYGHGNTNFTGGYEGGVVYRPGNPKAFIEALAGMVLKHTENLKEIRQASEDIRKYVGGTAEPAGAEDWHGGLLDQEHIIGTLNGFDRVTQRDRLFIALYHGNEHWEPDPGAYWEENFVRRAVTTYHHWPRFLLTDDEYSAFWEDSNTFIYRGPADLVQRLRRGR
jgi:hypothetical protein